MPEWYDIGNLWRNIYLLNSGVTALGLGVCFTLTGLMGKRRLVRFLAGVASTPFMQFLWMLFWALVWPDIPRMLCVFGLPALWGAYLICVLIRNRRSFTRKALSRALCALKARALGVGKSCLVCLALVFAMGCLLLPPVVRMATNNSNGMADVGEYMGLAVRYCEDRDFQKLSAKDDPEGHFLGHSHFPSMELYMSYGLMHSGGEMGYPYDKPAFTGIGILAFYFLAAYLAVLLVVSRGRLHWALLGLLLLNLTPELVYAMLIIARDMFRLLGLFVALAGLLWLKPEGTPKALAGKGLFMAVMCFCAMSTHVVCFVVLPFMVAAWALWRAFESLLARGGHAAGTLLKTLALSLCGAAGTLAAFAGNIECYIKWGSMSPFRIMSTYTSAPWYDMYARGEYRLEEVSTSLSFWQNRAGVFQQHATPLGVWGFWLSAVMLAAVLICLFARRRAAAPLSENSRESMSLCFFVPALTILTLLPVTGLMDTPLYSFSGAFAALPRYVMQWFIICCLPPVLLGATFEAHIIPQNGRRLAAMLCAGLCLAAFARGVSQSGYDTSVYRYSRDVMEDESLILDNAFRARYSTLMRLAGATPCGKKIVIVEDGDQYALKGKGYALTSNAMAPLMITPAGDLERAIKGLDIAFFATAREFWDTRYFALSELSEYLASLPPEQIIEDEIMRFYIIDRALLEQ